MAKTQKYKWLTTAQAPLLPSLTLVQRPFYIVFLFYRFALH